MISRGMGSISIYELADPQGAYIIAAGNDGLSCTSENFGGAII